MAPFSLIFACPEFAFMGFRAGDGRALPPRTLTMNSMPYTRLLLGSSSIFYTNYYGSFVRIASG
jgi:hypothetical protein